MMTALLYLISGLVAGALLITAVFLLARRSNGVASDPQGELVRRLEIIDRSLRDEFSRNREEAGAAAKNQREELARSLEGVRSIVDVRLQQLQDDNAKQIDKMRTNVKTRGGWSEWQLGDLLEDMLPADRVAKNMKTRDDTDDRVEFAIKFPGKDDNEAPVWLPIDAKFPMEHYERLAEAQEKADITGVETATKVLETQLKRCAKDICEKYINPPKTTNFALLFLPSEGLYAEAIRRVGLVQNVQRDCRVTFVGRLRLPPYSTVCKWDFRHWPFKSNRAKYGDYWPE